MSVINEFIRPTTLSSQLLVITKGTALIMPGKPNHLSMMSCCEASSSKIDTVPLMSDT
jgi:hypothetical protein